LNRILENVLRRLICVGDLQITTSDGATQSFGDRSGTPAAIRFKSRLAEHKVIFDSELRFGEEYVNGNVVVERGTIADVLAIILAQPEKPPSWARIHSFVRYLRRQSQQLNSLRRARRNVAHHYDLDNELYRLFLDADQQYSCAYFESANQSLEDAQLAKKRHLAAKLITKPHQHILDIGCGWGGLAMYLARICDAQVTGITLSQNQRTIANARAADNGLSERTKFRLQDYRRISGTFDRIVSVGMFEHVGVGYYDLFFRKCAEVLDKDGIMVLSSIGRSEGPNATNPWIAKYIFPGGYIPALSEVLPSVERAGLLVADIEILRLQYAETIKVWRERFLTNRKIVERRYGSEFARMWEFYLAVSEMAFRKLAMMVFQLQLTKRQGVVPNTRHYIERESTRLRAIEQRFVYPKLRQNRLNCNLISCAKDASRKAP
jgi:cyclopropane-fatty-acyl-phospholipid synthase